MEAKQESQHAHDDFEESLRQQFLALSSKGLGPNDAAAVALKLAFGKESLQDLATTLRCLKALKTNGNQAGSYAAARDAAVMAIRALFSSQEVLFFSAALPGTCRVLFSPGEGETQASDMPSRRSSGDEADGKTAGGNSGYIQPDHVPTQIHQMIAFKVLREVFEEARAAEEGVGLELVKAAKQMLKEVQGKCKVVLPWMDSVPAIGIMCTMPQLLTVETSNLTLGLVDAVASCTQQHQEALVKLFTQFPAWQMTETVFAVQQFITLRLYEKQQLEEGSCNATVTLELLERANRRSANPIPYQEFYNDAVNSSEFNIKEDYRRWKKSLTSDGSQVWFSFCHYPFMLDPAAKAIILKFDNMYNMYHQFHEALVTSLTTMGASSPYLVLKVRRDYLVSDALLYIQHARKLKSLKRPLKVQFVGEHGVDEGGVQKEFFQLLLRDLFNPSYGMFQYDRDTRLYWFRPSPASMVRELSNEFALIGILIGLAIYNSHILEFSFPMVIYKKLLAQPLEFDDLKEAFPQQHASLLKLMAMPHDDIEHLGLNFALDQDLLGEISTVDLCPNGADRPVTGDNVQEYVQLYTVYLLVGSIREQFSAFKAGFDEMCDSKVLNWLRPEELEQLVCGSPLLDLCELQRAAQYQAGFDSESQAVVWMWEVLEEMNEAQRKRFLSFVTGSDRVPIKGLATLDPPFTVSRNGPHSDRLPTAHTCFNHLLLPDYDSKEALKDRLTTAIENAEGFGLI